MYIIMAIFIIECCSTITFTCYALVYCFHCDVAACGTLHAQIDVSQIGHCLRFYKSPVLPFKKLNRPAINLAE